MTETTDMQDLDELKMQVFHHLNEIVRWTETLEDEARNPDKHASKRVLKEALRHIDTHSAYITKLVT